MAIDRKSDEILLNALVDGELEPAEQAAAARRLASDREFACAYATLSRLKASVTESAEAGIGEIRMPTPAPQRRWRIAAVGIAGALAAGLMLALAFPRFLFPVEAPPPRAAAETLVKDAFSGEAVIPDLSPEGLQLARTVVRTSSGTQALVATYLGPRGCRLELRISDVAAFQSMTGGTDRKSWQVGSTIYELVAYGMPADRFARVAQAAEEATRAPVLPDSNDQRLIEARVSTAPCVT